MQKILIALEIPDQIPAQDLADSVTEILIDSLGAVVVHMKVVTPSHALTL